MSERLQTVNEVISVNVAQCADLFGQQVGSFVRYEMDGLFCAAIAALHHTVIKNQQRKVMLVTADNMRPVTVWLR